MDPILIDINPKMLIWAREETFGKMPLEKVAKKLKINVLNMKQWEIDGLNIPLNKLELLAKHYKRQTAIFFLTNVPPRTKTIKDYRNLAIEHENFSPDVLLAIRRTERYLEIARELKGKEYWNQQYKWFETVNHDLNINREIEKIRSLLDIKVDRLNMHRSEDAFRYWRSKIEEDLGIFIFQFPMTESEIDGFSYAFKMFPYAIVLNNKKIPVRKIFTLFHELAHILKHNPGACTQDFSSNIIHNNIEQECNSFAGEFLVPAKSIEDASSVDEITKFARSFNISNEVYLRRLFDEKKIDREVFFRWLEEIRDRSSKLPKRKAKGAPSMIIQSKSTRGNKFFDLVTNAMSVKQISLSSASDLLGLKIGNIMHL